MPSVRPPAVAGTFYPARPADLASTVTGFLDEARTGAESGPVPRAILVPHAGYIYSGSIAARGYVRLEPARDTLHHAVILGPTHRVPVVGLALPAADAMATPLGEVPVAVPDVLRGLPQVVRSARVHRDEHSLEVQLPFLQTVLGDFDVVPLAVGDATASEVAEVIEALWDEPGTVVVISSDLSHYHSYDRAREIDRATVEAILGLTGPLDHEQACGAYPANGMLRVAVAHHRHPTLYGACNSGDTAGDRARVVGYASIGFLEDGR